MQAALQSWLQRAAQQTQDSLSRQQQQQTRASKPVTSLASQTLQQRLKRNSSSLLQVRSTVTSCYLQKTHPRAGRKAMPGCMLSSLRLQELGVQTQHCVRPTRPFDTHGCAAAEDDEQQDWSALCAQQEAKGRQLRAQLAPIFQQLHSVSLAQAAVLFHNLCARQAASQLQVSQAAPMVSGQTSGKQSRAVGAG